MTDDTEARAIAARLTKAQRRYVLAWPREADVLTTRHILRNKGLLLGWELTDLGLRVRAALVEMEGRG